MSELSRGCLPITQTIVCMSERAEHSERVQHMGEQSFTFHHRYQGVAPVACHLHRNVICHEIVTRHVPHMFQSTLQVILSHQTLSLHTLRAQPQMGDKNHGLSMPGIT